MIKIYHNPRCSKSRQALEILKNEVSGDIQIIEYLKSGFSKDELKEILQKLKLRPATIIRKKEAKEFNIDINCNNDDNLIQAIVDFPKIIERPIILTEEKACIGRPPEKVKDIL